MASNLQSIAIVMWIFRQHNVLSNLIGKSKRIYDTLQSIAVKLMVFIY